MQILTNSRIFMIEYALNQCYCYCRMTKLNPLLIGRLILIVDYMLHCFYEAPPTLSEKVCLSFVTVDVFFNVNAVIFVLL